MLTEFEDRHGDAGKALSRLIRPAICAPEGRTLVWGDWSAIEARLTPWIAGGREAQKVLDVIARSDEDPDAPDIYEVEAGKILRKPASEVDKRERQGYGKVTVLSLGFGGSVGALQAMAAAYRVSFTEKEAREIVDAWREGNPWARRWWTQLWEAFQSAMESPGSVFSAGRVAFTYDPGYMSTVYMLLPDGRPIPYRKAAWKWKTFENEDGSEDKRYCLTYWRGSAWKALWYGELANNAVQGTAGSRLREALTVLSPAPELDATGREVWPDTPAEVVGHTHDEIVAETEEDRVETAADWLYREMMRIPDWLEGCPMAAEVETNQWYTKANIARQLRG